MSYAAAASVPLPKDPRCFCLPRSHMCASNRPVRLYRVTPRCLPLSLSSPACVDASAVGFVLGFGFEVWAEVVFVVVAAVVVSPARRQNSRCCARESRSRPSVPRLPILASSSTSGWMRVGARRRRLRSGASGFRRATSPRETRGRRRGSSWSWCSGEARLLVGRASPRVASRRGSGGPVA